jgi:hypothetical protein
LATWIVCPKQGGPLQDRGHVLLRWGENGVVNAVSLHGDTGLNRLLVRFIAEHLAEVRGR